MTSNGPTSHGRLLLDPLVLECADALARVVRVGEDVTRGIFATVSEPVLATNVAFVIVTMLFVDGPSRPKGIREVTGLSSGGASAALERLEEAGLVTRAFGGIAGDRRAIVVALTPYGYEQVRVVAAVVDASLDRLFLDLAPILERRLAAGLPTDVADLALGLDDAPAADDSDLLPDPGFSIRRRTRENMLIISRMARMGEEVKELIAPLQLEYTRHQNVSHLAMSALVFRGPLRPSEIALATGLSSGGVTGLVDRLETAGMVTRDLGVVPGDRRGVLVRATDAGIEFMRLRMEIQAPPVDRLLDELAATAAGRAARPGIASAVA